MEELTKTQIILLTLLISFVTSIATGIVTVTLLDQAPPEVTQTINRVVEKTVEKIVPIEKQATIITKEIPVVIKEEDLVVSAVEKNSKSVVRIHEVEGEAKDLVFQTLGVVVSKNGLIAVPKEFFDPQKKYSALFPDAKLLNLEFVPSNTTDHLVLFKAVLAEKEKYQFIPVSVANSDSLKLGQTVIALGGDEVRNSVGVGAISGIALAEEAIGASTTPETLQSKKVRAFIETTFNSRDKSSGFVVLNLAGELAGVYAFSSDELVARNTYLPSNILKEEIVPKPEEKSQIPLSR